MQKRRNYLQAAALCWLLAACGAPVDEPVLTINGDAVGQEEFLGRMEQNRAVVIGYFQRKNASGYPDDFWTHSYDGTTPLEVLRDSARKQLADQYLKMQLAESVGVIADAGYLKRREAWQAENERRRKAVAAREIVFGPTVLTFSGYETYLLSNLENTLADRLGGASNYRFRLDSLRRKAIVTVHLPVYGKMKP
ncbi:MAG: hypothetical protein J7576_15165 [Siphonobacter aquaeclarae]|nr:hypothetical protein [Siphonobacter aquaeclarae]